MTESSPGHGDARLGAIGEDTEGGPVGAGQDDGRRIGSLEEALRPAIARLAREVALDDPGVHAILRGEELEGGEPVDGVAVAHVTRDVAQLLVPQVAGVGRRPPSYPAGAGRRRRTALRGSC